MRFQVGSVLALCTALMVVNAAYAMDYEVTGEQNLRLRWDSISDPNPSLRFDDASDQDADDFALENLLPPNNFSQLTPENTPTEACDPLKKEWDENDVDVYGYIHDAKTELLERFAYKNAKKGHEHGPYLCFQAVKKDFYKIDLGGILAGGLAKQSEVGLREMGMVNLLKDRRYACRIPDQFHAPLGSVLVFRRKHPTRKHHAGHVEIKTPWGYASDWLRPISVHPELFDLVGVYIMPGGFQKLENP